MKVEVMAEIRFPKYAQAWLWIAAVFSLIGAGGLRDWLIDRVAKSAIHNTILIADEGEKP